MISFKIITKENVEAKCSLKREGDACMISKCDKISIISIITQQLNIEIKH